MNTPGMVPIVSGTNHRYSVFDSSVYTTACHLSSKGSPQLLKIAA